MSERETKEHRLPGERSWSSKPPRAVVTTSDGRVGVLTSEAGGTIQWLRGTRLLPVTPDDVDVSWLTPLPDGPWRGS